MLKLSMCYRGSRGWQLSVRCVRRSASDYYLRRSSTLSSQSGFPGAPKSPMTTKMNFLRPSEVPLVPTFHILDAQANIAADSPYSGNFDGQQVLSWYKNMLTVNIMDSIMFEAQRHGRLSFYMVSAGEEAIMIGSAAALAAKDVITCQYRETGVFLQRGFTLKDFMSQLVANKNDPGKGRNMPVQFSGKLKVGVHAVASTLGTQIPHATGAAYAFKMDALQDPTLEPRVAVSYFGEGAASEGDCHAALNMAAVLRCPVVFLCRNNGFAISTPASQQYAGDGIAARGMSYGIESIRVDGTDIFAVYEATKEARRKALENGGRPILVELMSYRVSHHSTSDDSFAYRQRSEVEEWKSLRSPIRRLKKWLQNNGLWNEEKDSEARKEIRSAVIKELVAAEKEQKPALSGIFTDVYAQLTDESKEQKDELRRIMAKYPAEYDVDQHEGGLDSLK